MATKSNYEIRTSLDKSFLDHEINPTGLSATTVRVSVLQVILWLLAVIVWMWAITASFIAKAGPLYIVLFSIWWLVLVLFLTRRGETRELVGMRVVHLLSYLPKSSREVLTRSINSPKPFGRIVGIKEVEESGLIRFYDQRVGQMYRVAGNASRLLFAEDRDALVAQYESFLNKLEPNVEVSMISLKEPQQVDSQLANLERRNQNLVVKDPELQDLLDEQFEVMDKMVGKRFRSTHQYLLVGAHHMDLLQSTHAVLAAELESPTSQVFSDIQILDRDEALEALSAFYRGRQ